MVVNVSLPPELRTKLSSLPLIKTVVEQNSTFEIKNKKKIKKERTHQKKLLNFINSTRCLRRANILFLFN